MEAGSSSSSPGLQAEDACLSLLASGLASRLVPKEAIDPNCLSPDLLEPRESLYIMQAMSRTCLRRGQHPGHPQACKADL